jgi:Holliday junction resolvasome RuvABC endonuclease subunit
VRVIGIDSAELSGFAAVDVGEGRELLLHHATFPARSAADVEAVVAQVAEVGADLVAIEEPFVHPRNPSTGLVLARLLGRWLQAFEARGLTTATVPASMWQPRLLPGVSYRTPSAARTAAPIEFVRQHFGVAAEEDAADAICLALWSARNATRGKSA